MIDKILVGMGILLGSVLIIENMVSGLFGYLFLDQSANNGLIIFVAILIGISMGFGIKGMISNKEVGNEDEDFNF